MTARLIGPTVLFVHNFGAWGDGVSNDTRAIQCAIDALPADGGTVLIPEGTYRIDPTQSVFPRSHTRLRFEANAKFVAIANDDPKTNVIWIRDVEHVEVIGGLIVGDRFDHTYIDTGDDTRTHEWGHGIKVGNSSKVSLADVVIEDCAGDGVSISGNDIELDRVTARRCRRQGLTIAAGTRFRVRSCMFELTGDLPNSAGTAPKAGIAIEPDGGLVSDVWITKTTVRDNTGDGIMTYVRPNTGAVIRDIGLKENIVERNANGINLFQAQDVLVQQCQFIDQRYRGLIFGIGSSGIAKWNTFNRRGERTPFTQVGTSEPTRDDLFVHAESGIVDVGSNKYI